MAREAIDIDQNKLRAAIRKQGHERSRSNIALLTTSWRSRS